MNRKFLIPVVLLTLMLCSGVFTANAAGSSSADKDDYKIGCAYRDRLPANARTFIDYHFGYYSVADIEREDGRYEVELKDGTELEFGRHGKCRKIKAGKRKVLAWRIVYNLLPRRARTAIARRNLRNKIKSISIEDGEIEVEFRGSRLEEIKFDRNGNILDKDRRD